MDCREVVEVLDAYALGAAQEMEAEELERHVAECVRCWDELNSAQRTAALLALTAPLQQAPDRLRARLMAAVERERPSSPQAAKRGIRARLGFRRPAAANALAGLGVVALALSAFLFFEVEDLRDDKSQLEDQVRQAETELGQQSHLVTVLAATDSMWISMEPVAGGPDGSVVYYWSRSLRKGFLLCEALSPPRQGTVYQLWFTEGDEAYRSVSFVPAGGVCRVPVDTSFLQHRPEGIGVSMEESAGSEKPSAWLLFASFQR